MSIDYTVPAVHRAIQVLEILGSSHAGFSLADLSRRTDIPKSSLFRILLTLEQSSLVLQDRSRDVYTLGMKLIDWGYKALEKIDLKTVSHPHIVRMAHETRESYYVAILDGNEVIIIDRADTPEIWQMVARLGQRSPVHATASGQVLIAELPPDILSTMIAGSGLKRFTSKTITAMPVLRSRLKEVRMQGFSIANAEYKPDLCVIAVPVRDHHGRVAAALMTALQSDRARKNKALLSDIIANLKKEAAVISREIGYLDPYGIPGNGDDRRREK